MQASSRIEHHEYFDGSDSVAEETTEVIRLPRPPSRRPSRSLTIVSNTGRPSTGRRHVSESDEADHPIQESHRRHRRDRSRTHDRSKSSSRGHHSRRGRRSAIDDEGKS